MPAVFKKELGLKESVSIVIGRIIGSGIFRTPGPILISVAGLDMHRQYQLSELSSVEITLGFFFIAWVLGGISTLLSSFCYAELVSLFPKAGGPYVYLKESYPEVVTFLRGWAMFFVSETASIVAVALVFSEYSLYILVHFFPSLGEASYLEYPIAFCLIWLLTLSNCYGVGLSGSFQNVFAVLKLIAVFTILTVGFGSPNGNIENITLNFWPSKVGLASFIGLGEAMRYAFFAYSGWEGATYVAEEVKNPKKNLPLSLFWGIGTVSLLYIMVNIAYLYQLTPAEVVVSKKQVAAYFMQKSMGEGAGGLILAGLIMLSTFGNVGTQIMVKARTWYAMARDGLFPKIFFSLDEKYKTPNRGLYLQGVWASLLLFYSSLFTNSYEGLIDLFSFTSATFNTLTFTAVIILRKKRPLLQRDFKTPLFIPTISIVLMIQLAFLIITFLTRPFSSLLGVLLTCTGLLYYFNRRRVKTSN